MRAGQAITELANIDEIRVNFAAPEGYRTADPWRERRCPPRTQLTRVKS